jgi:metallo-beta-lactamase class B
MTKTVFLALLSISFGSAAIQHGGSVTADPAIKCGDCDGAWNAPREPFRVFGNTYYVGTEGLSSVLVTSDAGLVLLDGALPQSAPLIDANIRKLGFRIADVRLILNSHEHFDHAGGIAALQRASGAEVAVSAPAARALAQGYPTPDDPQYASGRKSFQLTPVRNIKVIKDGEAIRVGSLVLTPHLTPGHTPGATTWSWRSCEGARCVNVVYADSLSAVSDEGFRFTGDAARPSIINTFRRSIATVEQLPCDVLLSPHPGFVEIDVKLARWKKDPGTNPFIDPAVCRSYAEAARKRLDARIAEEKKVARASGRANTYNSGHDGRRRLVRRQRERRAPPDHRIHCRAGVGRISDARRGRPENPRRSLHRP